MRQTLTFWVFADGFTEEQLKESLLRVDMKKCTVRSLRRAAQNGGIPSDILATAALDLCDGLQDKLDASTKIIEVTQGRKACWLKENPTLKIYLIMYAYADCCHSYFNIVSTCYAW